MFVPQDPYSTISITLLMFKGVLEETRVSESNYAYAMFCCRVLQDKQQPERFDVYSTTFKLVFWQ